MKLNRLSVLHSYFLTISRFQYFTTVIVSLFSLFSVCLGSVFVSRCQDLSLEGPGGRHCGCCSGHQHAHCSVCPWTGLGAELPDPVSPRKIQEQSDLKHQQGNLSGCPEMCWLGCVSRCYPPVWRSVLSSTRLVRWGCGGPTGMEPNPATISLSLAFRVDLWC